MTVASTTNRNDYVGNGAVDTYSYSFRIFAETDLLVTIADTTGDETELILTTHYTVTGVGSSSGGNVALVNGSFDWLDSDGDLKTGYSLTIRRVRPLTQLTDIRNQGTFFPEDHEDAFDHLVFIAQQHQDELNRCLKAAETSAQEYTLPVASGGKLIGWNEAGDDLTNYAPNDGSVLAKASQAEAEAGTDNSAYMTPLRSNQGLLAQLLALATAVNFAKGSDLASATTTDIGAAHGNFVHITGTVTITGLGTVQAGTVRFVRFAGSLTLTHNATSLILPGGVSITTAANDTAIFVSEGSGNWRCICYSKASGAPVIQQAGGVLGTAKNLKVTRPSASTVTVTADELVLEDSSNNKVTARSVSVTADITASGANGLDTGTEAGNGANKTYHLWVIRKSSDGTTAALLVLEGASGAITAPVMPSGYDQKALVSAVRNDGSSNFISFTQTGRYVYYTAWQQLGTGTVSAWTALTMSGLVPSGISTLAIMQLSSTTNQGAYLTNDNTIGTGDTLKPNHMSISGNGVTGGVCFMPIITADTLYWGASSGAVYCAGYVINKLGA